MKTIISFITMITSLIVFTQPVRGDPHGGDGARGGGFAMPAPRASSSAGHVISAPAIRPAVGARPAFNYRRSYAPIMQAPRTSAYARKYVPRSTISLRQRDTARSTTTSNVQRENARPNSSTAVQRDRHQWHDRDWWRRHYSRFVLVEGGYYYWDDGFWYPCWGYDPDYDYYAYDGPIYAPSNLMPDQVISNVQIELQQEGYYAGPINGALDAPTRAAIANYQRDHGLAVSGTVDEMTVESLGLG